MAVGIVIRVNDATRGVEVSESALIGVVEGCWILLDNEPLLQWFDRSRLRGRVFGGVGIGTLDRTVGLCTTSSMDRTTLSSHSVSLLLDIEGEEDCAEAADCSFGSGWRPEWTSMTKAELTAENRPTYKSGLGCSWERTIKTTYENQGDIEVLVVLLDVVRIILYP